MIIYGRKERIEAFDFSHSSPFPPLSLRSILAVVRSERQEDYITFPHLAALMIDREGEREEREGDGLGGKKRLRRGEEGVVK